MKKIPFILTMLVLLLKLEVIAKKYSFSSDSLELENKTYLEEKTKLCLPSQENYFEENKGQITGKDASEVNFVHKSGNVSMFLMGSSIAYQFTKIHYPKGYEPIDKYSTLEEYKEIGKLEKKVRIETYRMDLVLENCNSKIEITTKGKSKDYIQYYNHDALDVHQYEEVTYHNVYPNIDWKFYKRGENIKYDFIVHPGGDPTQIKLKRKWGTDIKILTNGNIVFSTPMGSITENKPISFQEGREVNTQFLLENQNVSFSLFNYDVNQVLYIDPTVIWASYYGGSENEQGSETCVDKNNNVYLSGSTNSISGIASGGHQNTAGGGGLTDCYIAKLSSNCFTLPGSDNQIACGSYTWIDGNTYTSSNNTATHTLSTLNSCDSLVMLNLIINNTTFGIDTQVSCESYTWIDGITYTSSNNTAEYTLIGSNGCDSVVNLNLTINVPTTFTDIQTSCDSYTWIDGVTYTSSNNTAVHTLTGVNGCDSIIYLKLTINNTTIGTDYQTACESYTWIDGNTYISSNNTATYTLVNSAGCDSIITLNLSILPSLSSTDSVQACDSIVWIDGITYTTSNFTATNTLTSSTGCDSIITLNLIIYDTLDVFISYNRDSLFCTIGDSYQWFYNGVFIVGATNQWFIPLENGLYTVEVITSNGCNSSGDFNLNNVGVDSEYIKLSIFPNPVQELLYINANKRINYELYDTLGKLVVRSKLRVNSHVINTLSYEKGVYILRLKGEDNSQMIKRVILH